MKAKFIELHLLQSFPPSCVNRDGNNSPKDCMFGGERRARISSQCLKRAIRQADVFTEVVGEAIAARSKRIRDEKLIPYLEGKGLSPEQAVEIADKFRGELAKPDTKKPELTSVGLYFGDKELFALLDAYRADDKKWKSVVKPSSADVALFGRMLAEATDLNVDAASQVAHAISTHALSQETDFWTAADDLKDLSDEDSDAGADMLGMAEFNASIFYRYACVSLPILEKNLQDEAVCRRTVEAFLRASWDATPTGKLNGHAHFTQPFAALAVVRRKGMPLNLCNAFVKPIRSQRGEGLDDLSVKALLVHLSRSRTMSLVDDADYYFANSLDSEFNSTGVLTKSGYADVVAGVLEGL
ncbi:MAG: type I-E CRISPR-associated protein Cas7/Cse4/CasC [Fimbriimonadaceae bacterium]|nr:type I-E CRISPR-associated protein Cas7/Cse4/CasC [Fimbriimonadaceae bacterium]